MNPVVLAGELEPVSALDGLLDARFDRRARDRWAGQPATTTSAPVLAQTLTSRGHTSRGEAASTWEGRSAAQMELPSASASPTPALAEEREVAALRAGDERAFLVLVNRHHRGMMRVASFYVKDAATAEEVVQEAWLGVLRGLHLFEGRSSLKSWIFGILINCAKARAAREARSVPLSALEREQEEEGPSVPPERFLDDEQRWAGHWSQPPAAWPEETVASQEMVSLVREALETLPEAQRTVMSLRDVDGWDSSEVCDLLGISEGNQRVLLHRARSKVRGYLEQRLGREGRP